MNSLQLWLPEQDQDKILNFPAGSINWTQRVIQKKKKVNKIISINEGKDGVVMFWGTGREVEWDLEIGMIKIH